MSALQAYQNDAPPGLAKHPGRSLAALFILDAYAMFAILLIGKTDVSINITSERANETKKI